MQGSDNHHQKKGTRVSVQASLCMAKPCCRHRPYTTSGAIWSEVIFCSFGHNDAYESMWSNDAQRGEGGQFVPWLCVEQAVSYWLYSTFNHRISRTSMLESCSHCITAPPCNLLFCVNTHQCFSRICCCHLQ